MLCVNEFKAHFGKWNSHISCSIDCDVVIRYFDGWFFEARSHFVVGAGPELTV